TLPPAGLKHLESFEKGPTCRWTYRVGGPGGAGGAGGFKVVKELQVFRGQNAAAVTYRIERAGPSKSAARLTVRPLISLRDMHGLIRRSWADGFAASGSVRELRVERGGLEVHLRSDAMAFAHETQWWYDFHYALDAARGQDSREDLYSPGAFELSLGMDDAAEATVQISTAPLSMIDRGADRQRTRARLAAMHAAALASRPDPLAKVSDADGAAIAALVAASDDFVVARANPGTRELDQTSVIAGYPWFADWGRDTSIALPGLMLSTGRFEDARRSLLAFAGHRRNGIVPNVFDDRTGRPEYNTVDASLWFVHACCEYARRSGDRATFDGVLAAACIDVITCYRRGTDFNIAMDPFDKLVTAGNQSTQLTWMDAKRDGVAFTPRHGKAVEINALWYSALCELSAAIGPADATTAANLTDLAQAVGKSFRAAFWDQNRSCLYDRLAPSGVGDRPGWDPVSEMRPNQIFAASLPHTALSREQVLGVIAAVRHHLLTPMGVRTLGPDEPGYARRYEGGMFDRDRAYHNGTAWPWLLGPYAQAVLRAGAFSPEAKRAAREAIEPAIQELWAPRGALKEPVLGNCLGQLAEVYDAEAPQRPQGCTAQAWTVAELLRAMLML
ncbi:MAG: amylo-alpha-1,6-glucosidase, partial [Phycisphaerales bacterium]|nr:amylo-alpha-1,6-glucosidase [Phycisphaerales bacterium]